MIKCAICVAMYVDQLPDKLRSNGPTRLNSETYYGHLTVVYIQLTDSGKLNQSYASKANQVLIK